MGSALAFQSLGYITLSIWTVQELSQVRYTYLAHSPCLITLVESHSPHHTGLLLLPAIIRTISASTSAHNEAKQLQDLLTGSCAFLPTLKPNLTTLAPRLDTDCWLGFVRSGVSPHYMYSAELAHPKLSDSDEF